MRFLTWLVISGLVVALASPLVWAGPHEYGVLIAHLNPSLEYSPGLDPEGLSNLRDCEDAVVRGEVNSEKAQVWYVIASFHDSPGPISLALVDFGLGSFDAGKIAFTGYGPCHNNYEYLELPTAGWPGPNEGYAITYVRADRRTELMEMYWFASYVYGAVSIPLDIDPSTKYGQFASSDSPSIADEIWDYGIMGFGEDGYNPCDSGVQRDGACCLGDQCQVMTRDQCELSSGVYQGDTTDCFPNPCSSIETSWGRLKEIYR